MKIINTDTLEISTDRAVLAEIKKTVSVGPNTLAELGWQPVLAAPKPTPSTNLKTVTSNGATQDANGNWVDAYIERDMFADTVEDGVTTTKAEHETAYLAKLAATEAGAASEALKVSGIEILGVMCSATKEDQMGLTAVGLDYTVAKGAGGTFASTQFEFSNGNSLVITDDNFQQVYALWVPFRRSFFLPD